MNMVLWDVQILISMDLRNRQLLSHLDVLQITIYLTDTIEIGFWNIYFGLNWTILNGFVFGYCNSSNLLIL